MNSCDEERGKDVVLYNGVSQRSRGWKKSRKLGEFMEGKLPKHSNLKRWDGWSRKSQPWDSLRKDHELWHHRDGNCLIHLHEKGNSQRGPAFKLPIAALLAANCQPLIERFMVPCSREASDSESPSPTDKTSPSHGISSVNMELYIPVPPQASKEQSLLYHLATRNLFACIFRRPLVGDHLGNAIIGLMHSMQEFRRPGTDNIQILLDFLDEEGYLDMANEPNHALAILHFAEVFQQRDLYIDAFAHCVGMSDHLFLSGEYSCISSISRKLIRKTRADMDLRIGNASAMLRSFMEDDLSEVHLGLSLGGRAHLDRFRTFLLGFFSNKFGFYPPKNGSFDPHIFRAMCADFEALYEYLVDKDFTTAESSPFLAQGGICTLQSVHSFDLRHKYKSLPNPLPLLPEWVPKASKRFSWLQKGDKLKPDERLLSHASLLKATNKDDVELLHNGLVLAYKGFEEDLIFAPQKIDKYQKISLVDGRKIRWILVYAVYQTLRSCTLVPPEVRKPAEMPYCVAIPTANIPPWKEERSTASLRRRLTDRSTSSISTSTAPLGWPSSTSPAPMTPTVNGSEITPDVDYFAITHRPVRPNPPKRPMSLGPGSAPSTPIPSRTLSLRGSIKNAAVRRSMSLFKSGQRSELRPSSPTLPTFQEFFVGYGNNQDAKNPDAASPTTPEATLASATSRSPSTSSTSSSGSGATSTNSDDASAALSQGTEYSNSTWTSRRNSVASISTEKAMNEATASSEKARVSLPRRGSEVSVASSIYSTDDMNIPAIPRRSSARNSLCVTFRNDAPLEPSPLRIRKDAVLFQIPDNADEWEEMQIKRNDTARKHDSGKGLSFNDGDDDIKPAWEQFADLGGHTTVLPPVRQPKLVLGKTLKVGMQMI